MPSPITHHKVPPARVLLSNISNIRTKAMDETDLLQGPLMFNESNINQTSMTSVDQSFTPMQPDVSLRLVSAVRKMFSSPSDSPVALLTKAARIHTLSSSSSASNSSPLTRKVPIHYTHKEVGTSSLGEGSQNKLSSQDTAAAAREELLKRRRRLHQL